LKSYRERWYFHREKLIELKTIRVILSLVLALANLASAPDASSVFFRKTLGLDEETSGLIAEVYKQGGKEEKGSSISKGPFPVAGEARGSSFFHYFLPLGTKECLFLQRGHFSTIPLFLLFHKLIFYF